MDRSDEKLIVIFDVCIRTRNRVIGVMAQYFFIQKSDKNPQTMMVRKCYGASTFRCLLSEFLSDLVAMQFVNTNKVRPRER